MKEEPEKNKRKTKKISVKTIILAMLATAALFGIAALDMMKEVQEHPPEEVALYMEQCIGLPVTVQYDYMQGFSDSRYSGQIPYYGHAVLDDGATISFLIGLDRAFPFFEGGLYSTFEEEMIEHYAGQYGIKSTTDSYWNVLQIEKTDIEGEDSSLKKLLDVLGETSYIQHAGQELELRIEAAGGHTESITLNADTPLDYEALKQDLEKGIEWYERMNDSLSNMDR